MTILLGNKVMKKVLTSLAIFAGTTTSLLGSTNAAFAAVFNWSYTTGGGDVYTGMLEGEVQGDENTINVTSVFMSQLDGVDLPETPTVSDEFGNTSNPTIVTLDGTFMNFGACDDTSVICGTNGIFISTTNNFFSTTANFGDDFETFNPDNSNIAEKPLIPEPSLTLALVGLGISGLAKTFLKKA